MCLLLTRKAESPSLDEAWLRDFYKRNDDGFGFMYSVDGKMYVDKSLGKVDEFIKHWRRLEECKIDFVAHLRMRTHGDISLENCHPYMVLDGTHGVEMWMMHNGVLSNGNAKDSTKSDTWHFIVDYMRPLLDPSLGGNPDIVYNPAFKSILGSAIGQSNKLIFLDNMGRLSTINKAAGKEWNGMWLSNTYAWSAHDAKDEKSLPGKFEDSCRYGDHYGGYKGASSPVGEYINGLWCRFDSPNHPNHKDYKGAGSTANEKKSDAPSGKLTVVQGGKNSGSPATGSSEQRRAIQFTDDDEEDNTSLISCADMFQVLKKSGYAQAYDRITMNSMRAFLDHFGPQVLLDLLELVHAEIITEQVFINCATDYKLARSVLDDGYPDVDQVRSQIDKDVEQALALAEAAERDKLDEAARIRAADPVIAATAAKYEAERAIEQAKQSSVTAEMDAVVAAQPPAILPVQEPLEIVEMGNKISDVAKSLEEEPVNAETVAEETHLAESEAAAQLVGRPVEGAE